MSRTTSAIPSTIAAIARSSFPAFALLYAALFCAFGTESPFFPSFLAVRSLGAGEIGIILSVGTAVRIFSGVVLGPVADRFGTRRVLATAAAFAGLIALLYLPSIGFWPLLIVCVLHSVATAPLSPLADALSLNASAREGIYPYGWVRGVGSASFLLGTLASGQLVARFGIASIIVASSVCFFLMVVPLPRLPPTTRSTGRAPTDGIVALISSPGFRSMLIVAAMVIGSHAMSDAFAVIHWRAEGIGAGAISALLAEAVGSEIVVFLLIGPVLLRRLGPARCLMLAALAGTVRWTVFARSTDITVLAATESLHGLTFALVHLSCMQIIAVTVPEEMSGTAQTVYGTLCLGMASAVITLASGMLYGSFGANAFWSMAALSLAATPVAFTLRSITYPSQVQ